ncbi:hypothetical protein GCM10010313_83300 [Streptomyces violarus]|nr:hypothetical protein GCM10010313_83300 [Streptomyces violarus]
MLFPAFPRLGRTGPTHHYGEAARRGARSAGGGPALLDLCSGRGRRPCFRSCTWLAPLEVMRRRLVWAAAKLSPSSVTLLASDIVRTLVMALATAQGQIRWYATPSGR